jgi:hypothetical protein
MPSLPESLTRLVASMLSRTPEKRPRDLESIAEQLRGYAD